MSEEEEPICLHCMPVAWDNGSATRIPGTLEFECEDCGQPILVAPSGQRLMASRGAHALCVPCGQDRMAEDGIEEPSRPTEDQMKELRDALLRDKL